jgi:hypothetical protein
VLDELVGADFAGFPVATGDAIVDIVENDVCAVLTVPRSHLHVDVDVSGEQIAPAPAVDAELFRFVDG